MVEYDRFEQEPCTAGFKLSRAPSYHTAGNFVWLRPGDIWMMGRSEVTGAETGPGIIISPLHCDLSHAK